MGFAGQALPKMCNSLLIEERYEFESDDVLAKMLMVFLASVKRAYSDIVSQPRASLARQFHDMIVGRRFVRSSRMNNAG